MKHDSYRPTKRRTLYALACLVLVLFWFVPTAAQESPSATQARPGSVLFVGNSLTMYNNAIYTHLRQFLVADDPAALERVFTKAMMISGGLLSDHRGGLMQMLDARDWDVVVLQGHSREALDEDKAESFANTTHAYVKAIRDKGGKPVLFMTWAYADQPGMTSGLNDAYTRLGQATNTRVVPVGLAFAGAIEQIPGVKLYVPDKVHPRLEGTYLAAAVFYASLFGKSPVELDYDAGLDENLARQLRAVAWQTVREYAGH